VKKEKLAQALDEIRDGHILEAAKAKKHRGLKWFGLIAAVLAIVILARSVEIPLIVTAKAVSRASGPRLTQQPQRKDYLTNEDAYYDALDDWRQDNQIRSQGMDGVLPRLERFMTESCREFLSGSEENLLYSPVNAYIGLAMTAELAAGNSRQQLLDALGADSTDALRESVHYIFESVYQDNGNEISTLANSLWLDKSLGYSQSTMDDLAYHYYADIYRRNLRGSGASRDIGNWLVNNTGGFLKGDSVRVQLPEEPILSLYSTIFFQSKWSDEFNPVNNTQDIFHGTAGDTRCTFMNAKLRQMHYYWGSSFGAVSLSLKNGSHMWLILPDGDKTLSDVLQEQEYYDMITTTYDGWENRKYMKVNLSLPKFDISAQADLRSGLANMGITDIFSLETADFSQTLAGPACISGANQSVRVAIDEKGVTAAAYIEIPGAGAAEPPEEIIDFILDRPFLFVIADNSGVLLFAGAVNQP